MTRPPGQWNRIPLLRGLIRLALSISPLFRTTGAARRSERTVLALVLVAPFAVIFLPEVVGTVAAVAVTAAAVGLLLRGRALALHGAEHRAIAAAEVRAMQATWDGRSFPSRFSPRCGTNFAALALPMSFATQALWPLSFALWTPVVLLLVSLSVTMELWQAIQSSSRGPLRLLLAPGLAVQRLTTREPSLGETRVALTAVAAVLERESVSA
jgi:uncharacterized protein YqhQ